MKKLLFVILSLSLLCTFPGFAEAGRMSWYDEEQGCEFIPILLTVKLDETELVFDEEPVERDDRVLVPLRAIFEALGCEVLWNGETQEVRALKDGTELALTIGSKAMVVNGAPYELEVPASLVHDRTMVPLRAVSEALDVRVVWNQFSRNTVEMFSPAYVNNLPYQSNVDELVALLWKPASEMEALVGPVIQVQNETFAHEKTGGDLWFEYDGPHYNEAGEMVPGGNCISIHGPLRAFLPGADGWLSEGAATLYFGDLAVTYKDFMKSDVFVADAGAGNLFISCEYGRGVNADSQTWLYLK